MISIMNRIAVDTITQIPTQYPIEFMNFVEEHKLKPPKLDTGNGKALALMLDNPSCYWTREDTDKIVNKFNIPTRDSIQLFNKHEQWGIQTSNERGKNYILVPYALSNKHKMRKNFGKELSEDDKLNEIEKIKSTIHTDYYDLPNNKWELGHKNPESVNNSLNNLVLQPPIQAKYRDRYIFIDTLTKIPTPSTLFQLDKNGDNPYTKPQLIELKKWLNNRHDLCC